MTIDMTILPIDIQEYITRLENENALLRIDCHSGFMNANGAMITHPTIPQNKRLIFVDMCNVHAMNHRYTMRGVNERWINTFSSVRLTDIIIKWGGDEFIIIVNDDTADIEQFIQRLDQKAHQNDCYAIYGVVSTSFDLAESVNRADELVSAVKLSLELNNMKPGRDQVYSCLDSHVIYE